MLQPLGPLAKMILALDCCTPQTAAAGHPPTYLPNPTSAAVHRARSHQRTREEGQVRRAEPSQPSLATRRRISSVRWGFKFHSSYGCNEAPAIRCPQQPRRSIPRSALVTPGPHNRKQSLRLPMAKMQFGHVRKLFARPSRMHLFESQLLVESAVRRAHFMRSTKAIDAPAGACYRKILQKTMIAAPRRSLISAN
jgi:hypothetical protein